MRSLMNKRTLVRLLAVVTVALAPIRGICQDPGDQVFDRIVENWRWSHYWFGKTGIDDAYVEGKKVSVLIFWTKSDSQPIRGLCSTELSLCVAYSGVYLDPRERRMRMAPNVAPQQAFTSWVNDGLRDPTALIGVQGLSMADFEVVEKSVTLPVLEPPSSITHRAVPEKAAKEAERVKRLFGCWGVDAETRPQGCSGSLVFSYYGDKDPYWFVLRSCSTACELKGNRWRWSGAATMDGRSRLPVSLVVRRLRSSA